MCKHLSSLDYYQRMCRMDHQRPRRAKRPNKRRFEDRDKSKSHHHQVRDNRQRNTTEHIASSVLYKGTGATGSCRGRKQEMGGGEGNGLNLQNVPIEKHVAAPLIMAMFFSFVSTILEPTSKGRGICDSPLENGRVSR